MEIKSAIAKLGKPETYGPTVIGGVAGVFGSVYALNYLRQLVPTAQYGATADWGVPLGWTAAMIVGMLSVKQGGMVNSAIHTALLTGAVTGGVVLLSKALGASYPSPMSVSGVARSGVRVVGRPAQTPTYAQAPTPAPVKETLRAF